MLVVGDRIGLHRPVVAGYINFNLAIIMLVVGGRIGLHRPVVAGYYKFILGNDYIVSVMAFYDYIGQLYNV